MPKTLKPATECTSMPALSKVVYCECGELLPVFGATSVYCASCQQKRSFERVRRQYDSLTRMHTKSLPRCLMPTKMDPYQKRCFFCLYGRDNRCRLAQCNIHKVELGACRVCDDETFDPEDLMQVAQWRRELRTGKGAVA